jgi:hypothetical protein
MAEINSLKFNLETKKNQATMLQIAQIDVHLQIACLESVAKDQNLNRQLGMLPKRSTDKSVRPGWPWLELV